MPDDLYFKDPKQLKMTDEEYELSIAITHLISVRDKIGIDDETHLTGSKSNPKEHENKTIIRYALEIYRIWGSLFPIEHQEFIESTKNELDVERPIKQAIKAGGYSPIAFPTRLDRLFNTLMPGVKTQDKRFWIPILKHIPELRRTNYL